MTSGPRRRRSRIATGTAGLGLAVLLVSSAAVWAADEAGVAADFENGRKQFHRTCAQCHGLNMVNSGVTVYDLRKFPIDQSERFFASITNGKGNMPSFRDALDAEQMRLLWVYVSRRGKAPQ
ncbi:MAG TPA: c-type cytochrome [Burkholderiales bacterium]|nr:c-type cytochrome [Burkholderiales bacterium]